MRYKTRENTGAVKFFATFEEAFEYAEKNKLVWKITFNSSDNKSLFRLIRNSDNSWKNVPYRPVNSKAE